MDNLWFKFCFDEVYIKCLINLKWLEKYFKCLWCIDINFV